MSDINITINVYVRPVMPAEHVTFNIKIDKPETPEEIFNRRMAEFAEVDSHFRRIYWRVACGHPMGMVFHVVRKNFMDDFHRVLGRYPNDAELFDFSSFSALKSRDGTIEILKDRFGDLNDE